jgi:phage regulator Rha-like protein
MKVLEFIYNEKSISFNPTGNDNVMVNATEMAKVFGKDLFQFTKSDATKRFIEACLKPANAGLLNLKSEEDLIISKQKSGTWMHRILALKFAAWLDPEFEVWVWTTIDQILLGHYREVKAAVYEKMNAEKERDFKRKQLLNDNPEFIDFLSLEGKITEAEKKRQKALKASMKQFKLDFQNS